MTRLTPPLHYAPRRRQRRLGRAVGIMALLGVLVGAGARLGPGLWARARLLYWQRQCLRYEAPPDRVVSAEPDFDASAGPVFFLSAPPDPAALAQLARFPSFAAAAGRATNGPVLYMHERRTPGGRAVLVIVRRTPPSERQSIDAPIGYHIELIERASLTHAPAFHEFAPPLGATNAGEGDLRFFAGQSDPKDESRFTIRYDNAGAPGTIRGRVLDAITGGVGGLDVELESAP